MGRRRNVVRVINGGARLRAFGSLEAKDRCRVKEGKGGRKLGGKLGWEG